MTIKNLALSMCFQNLVAVMRTVPFLRLTKAQIQQVAGHVFPDASEFVATIADTLLFLPDLYPDMAGEGEVLRDAQHEADSFAFLQRVFQTWAEVCHHNYLVRQSAVVQHARRLSDRVALGLKEPDLQPGLNHRERYLQILPATLMWTRFRDQLAQRRQATIERKHTDPTYPQRLAEAQRLRQQKRAAAEARQERKQEIRDLFTALRPGR